MSTTYRRPRVAEDLARRVAVYAAREGLTFEQAVSRLLESALTYDHATNASSPLNTPRLPGYMHTVRDAMLNHITDDIYRGVHPGDVREVTR